MDTGKSVKFFYQKHSAADAQKKAFLVTKLGDIGMFLGILLLGALVLKAGVNRVSDQPLQPGQEPVMACRCTSGSKVFACPR